MKITKKRVCIVTASEMTVKSFLLEQISALSRHYDVTVVVNTSDPSFLERHGCRARVVPVAIERNIRPIKDLQAIVKLVTFFRENRFELVHSVTPKAGLLAMIAARLANVPARIHIFTGQVWATQRGLFRHLLRGMDRLLALAATKLLADSASQRGFLIDESIVSPQRIAVLGKGSVGGVDLRRFAPNSAARARIRSMFEVCSTDVLFLFLGRLNRDKGLLDLASSFVNVASVHPNAKLLVVGPDEGGIVGAMKDILSGFGDRVSFVPYTDAPQDYMAAADVFCLPSYREGFGSVIIEAAATGVPTIGSNIYGISDAIEANYSGLLFEVGDVNDLTRQMCLLVSDVQLRERLGRAAQDRAVQHFDSARFAQAWVDFYKEELSDSEAPRPG